MSVITFLFVIIISFILEYSTKKKSYRLTLLTMLYFISILFPIDFNLLINTSLPVRDSQIHNSIVLLAYFYCVIRNLSRNSTTLPYGIILLIPLFLVESVIFQSLILTTYFCVNSRSSSFSLYASMSMIFFNIVSIKFGVSEDVTSMLNGLTLFFIGCSEFTKTRSESNYKAELYFAMMFFVILYSTENYMIELYNIHFNIVLLMLVLPFSRKLAQIQKYIITSTIIIFYILTFESSLVPFMGLLFFYAFRIFSTNEDSLKVNEKMVDTLKKFHMFLIFGVALGVSFNLIITGWLSLVILPVVFLTLSDILEDRNSKKNVYITEIVSIVMLVISYGAMIL